MTCRVAALVVIATGCAWREGAPEGSPGHVSEANQSCANLFCSAEAQSREQPLCAPSCMCGEYAFSEPVYDAYDLAALRSWRLLNPPSALPQDPYEGEMPALPGEAYCAAIPVDEAPHARTYRLETFPTRRAVLEAGGQVTHRGRCGACSSFQDLAVYIERRNLNRAGRLCGLQGTFGDNTQMGCLKRLGFTEACAQIWSFNIDHTRSVCLGICVANLTADNTVPNGSLNTCLACDEANSGPVFKAVAGRTRRRSGLSSTIARPCLDADGKPAIHPVEHYYFSADASAGRTAGGKPTSGQPIRDVVDAIRDHLPHRSSTSAIPRRRRCVSSRSSC